MWIELHDGARDHPKVIKLARALGIPKVYALGHMVSLWTWALRMAPDGNLSSFDVEDIELGAEWEGDLGNFVEVCKKVGLIDKNNLGEFCIHDWEFYANHLKLSDRKRRERERKREYREKQKNVSLGHSGTSGTVPGTKRTVPFGDGVSREPTDRQTDRKTDRRQTEIQQVVDHYVGHFSKRKVQAKNASTKIRARLKEGYSADQLCLAIDNMVNNPFNAENGHTNIDLVVRNATQVDKYLDQPKNNKTTKVREYENLNERKKRLENEPEVPF